MRLRNVILRVLLVFVIIVSGAFVFLGPGRPTSGTVYGREAQAAQSWIQWMPDANGNLYPIFFDEPAHYYLFIRSHDGRSARWSCTPEQYETIKNGTEIHRNE